MVVPRPESVVPSPAPVIFFGTPRFAVPPLEALARDARFSVRLVVTQPPRPAGRGQTVHPSAVQSAAEILALPVFAPDRLRGAEVVSRLGQEAPALFVVAAYGKILRPDILAIPDRGTLNVHASLLPAYRGASPVHGALLDGVAETGVTIMLMDVGLDTGPILAQECVTVSPDATTASLTEELAMIGSSLLVETAARWLTGKVAAVAQDEAAATLTRLIRKEDGEIDWSLPAARLARMERAFTPWPRVSTVLDGLRLLLYGLHATAAVGTGEPGTIVDVSDAGMRVRTGDGDLIVAAVQPEGKGRMTVPAFAAGRPGIVGARLGQRHAPERDDLIP